MNEGRRERETSKKSKEKVTLQRADPRVRWMGEKEHWTLDESIP